MRTTLLVGILLVSATAQADTITGRVVAIADGDTLTILDGTSQQHRIRVAGIDAPEKAQDFGQRSKTSLSAMAYNQTATADCPKRDRYNRGVCKIIVNGQDLGLEQVRAGMAWWYKQYSREQSPQDRADYEQAEFQAKTRRVGLWDSTNPVPPWEWRHRK